ncbi:hypothetical protein DMENIID0001_049020 [Sergentomyia squamirostris]
METTLSVIVCLWLAQMIVGMPQQDWGEQAAAAGAVIMAEGVERFRDGVSMKEKYGRKFDVFGVPVGGEIDYKVGVGDSLNRDRRQVVNCKGKGGRTTEIPEQNQRRRRQTNDPEDDVEAIDFDIEIPDGVFDEEGGDVEPGEKKWHKKFWESCKRLAKRISKFFQSQG